MSLVIFGHILRPRWYENEPYIYMAHGYEFAIFEQSVYVTFMSEVKSEYRNL